MFKVFFGNAQDQGSDPILKLVWLPYPISATKFRIDAVDENDIHTLDKRNIEFGIELIGLGPKNKYSIDPMMETKTFKDSKRA